MKKIALLILSSAFIGNACAAAGSISISSPKEGAMVPDNADVVFDVHPTVDGNHLHFYVDGGPPDIVREWKGDHTVSLTPGKHQICIKEATADHVLTGLQKCVDVTAK